MWRKVRYPLAVFLLLLVVLIGATLQQVHHLQLNRDLIMALDDYKDAESDEDLPRYELKVLAALKAGADPNCWAYVDLFGKIERPSWRDWLLLNFQPFGGKKNRYHFRRSALRMAVLTEDPKIVKALLDRGADVHMKVERSQMEFSGLGVAVQLRNEEIVNLFLDHGEDINSWQTVTQKFGLGKAARRTTANFTPLMIAAMDLDDAMVRLLIRRGANVNLRTKKGRTALGLVLVGGSPKPSDKEMLQIVQMLKAAGAKE